MGTNARDLTDSKKQVTQVRQMLGEIQELQRKEFCALVEVSRYLNEVMKGGGPFRSQGLQYKSYIKDLAPGLFDRIDRMRKILQFLRDGEQDERTDLINELPDLEFMKMVELSGHPDLADEQVDDYIQRYIRDAKQSTLSKREKEKKHGIRTMRDELKGLGG